MGIRTGRFENGLDEYLHVYKLEDGKYRVERGLSGWPATNLGIMAMPDVQNIFDQSESPFHKVTDHNDVPMSEGVHEPLTLFDKMLEHTKI
jgi:hypothetical protein